MVHQEHEKRQRAIYKFGVLFITPFYGNKKSHEQVEVMDFIAYQCLKKHHF